MLRDPTSDRAEAASVSDAGSSESANGSKMHLGRFNPRDNLGSLIDSEHLGRYLWASRAVAGKDVLDAGCGVGDGCRILVDAGATTITGLDNSQEAITQARAEFPELSDSFHLADLCRIDLPDDGFDVVVCFETIQMIADGERALSELSRVLRPGGLLLISSPRREGLPDSAGHVHEYYPAEFTAVIEERFANVARYRQHPWLASSIEPLVGDVPGSPDHEVRATTRLEPGEETNSLLVASDREIPDLGSLVTLGGDFDVKRWAEQVTLTQADARRQIRGVESRAREQTRAEAKKAESANQALEEAKRRFEVAENDLRRRFEAAENDLRRRLAHAEVAEKKATERLHETAAALLSANQSLAKLPALKHRQEEIEAQRAHIELLEGSRSWRYLAIFRRLGNLIRRR